MLYFAYGSKMDFREMRAHCPSARFLAVACLPDHRLDFTAYSRSHECGVADAVPCHGTGVWGVIYEVAEIEFARLDVSEGYEPGRPDLENDCTREQRHVLREGHRQDPILVWLYRARRLPHSPVPSSTTKGLMVEAAKFWHLPPDYIEQLQRTEAA